MQKNVLLLNGPNLNLLGSRQPDIYGVESLDDIVDACRKLASELDLGLRAEQSNHEGTLVDLIQEARASADAIIINAGAYSHTSVAILDALNSFDGDVIEVHLSNIHKREAFRHHSFISSRASGIIVGCGSHGYLLALRQLAHVLNGTTR